MFGKALDPVIADTHMKQQKATVLKVHSFHSSFFTLIDPSVTRVTSLLKPASGSDTRRRL
ncbi:MAG TPA: hypothetical protein ENI15_16890 [Spirochaetes bacterium]|nr:hypothetical protein [Spirochaetota bacterium]